MNGFEISSRALRMRGPCEHIALARLTGAFEGGLRVLGA